MTDYLGLLLIYAVIGPAWIAGAVIAVVISLGVVFGIPLWIVGSVIGEARREAGR